jgi:hypothetical protein
MKKVKVKIIDNRTRFSVGDKVEFDINGTTYTDTIVYMDGSTIEGSKYYLTTMKLRKV